MSLRKTTQYGGDVVKFILNKIIKNNKKYKFELSAKKMLVVHMVLKPCARPPKKTHGFNVHGLGGPYKWF